MVNVAKSTSPMDAFSDIWKIWDAHRKPAANEIWHYSFPSVGFSGTPNNGTRYPYYSHATPIRIPKDMGMVWE